MLGVLHTPGHSGDLHSECCFSSAALRGGTGLHLSTSMSQPGARHTGRCFSVCEGEEHLAGGGGVLGLELRASLLSAASRCRSCKRARSERAAEQNIELSAGSEPRKAGQAQAGGGAGKCISADACSGGLWGQWGEAEPHWSLGWTKDLRVMTPEPPVNWA